MSKVKQSKYWIDKMTEQLRKIIDDTDNKIKEALL